MQCGIPVFKAQSYSSTYSAFHHKNALFGLGGATDNGGTGSSSSDTGKNRCVVVTDTANWSEASMGNGSSTRAVPHNAETTMFIDSGALDGGATGLRFLSNFLQSFRKYAYQQACPYVEPPFTARTTVRMLTALQQRGFSTDSRRERSPF